METNDETNENGLDRRKFLRFGLGFVAAAGIISSIGGGLLKASAPKSNKIKMLTPDGKLVEIDASKIEKEITSVRATNAEVQEWMSKKPNKQ